MNQYHIGAGPYRHSAERVIGDQRWTPLELEITVQARHNDDLRTKLANSIDSVASALGAAIDNVEGIDAPMPGRELAIALLALGVGLGLFRMIDPSIPVSALTDVLRVLARVPKSG